MSDVQWFKVTERMAYGDNEPFYVFYPRSLFIGLSLDERKDEIRELLEDQGRLSSWSEHFRGGWTFGASPVHRKPF